MKNILLAVLTLCWGITGVRAAYDISLVAGWNLVSLPEQQTNPDIEVVTRSLQGKVAAIWGYENGQWNGYFPGQPASTLSHMDAGRAYWVFMNQTGSLVGAGMKPASSLRLDPGWNFVGYNAAAAKTPTEVFGDNLAAIQAVYSFEGGTWRTYVPGATGNALASLVPGKGYWVQTSATTTANFGYTLNPRLRILGDAALQSITAIGDTTLTLASAQAAGLTVGDIIGGGLSAQTPNGIIRKITAITTAGNLTTLTTGTAGLHDAVQDGVIGVSVPLSSQALATALQAQLLPGETAEYVERTRAASTAGGTFKVGTIKVSLNRTVSFGGDSVKFQGELKIQPQLVVNIEVASFKLKSLRVVAEAPYNSEFSVDAGRALKDENSFPIGSVPLPNIVLPIGPLPAVFNNSIDISLDLSGEIDVKLNRALSSYSGKLILGVKYDDSAGFSPELSSSGKDSDIDSKAKIKVDASIEAKTNASLKFKLYGLAGPYISFHNGAEFTPDKPLKPWGVYLFLGGEVGFEMKPETLVGWGIKDAYKLGLKYTFEIYRKRLFPIDNGTASGLVIDDSGPLAGVTVAASKASTPVGVATTTGATGAYTLSLPPKSDYTLTFSKTGYQSRTVDAVEIDSTQTTNVPRVYMDTSISLGSFRGTVSNAFTGRPVANVLVTIRPGLLMANPESVGVVAYATTDANGQYTVSNIAPGYYLAEVEAPGYIKGNFIVLSLGGRLNDRQDGTISPGLSNTNWRIVLNWGADPSDLDSHLTGPIVGSTSRFHVYYGSRGGLTASPFANLDLDRISGYGPETVTIASPLEGTYRYYVHHYAGSGTLATSGAKVAVYRGNALQKTYSVPFAFGYYWNVFEIRNGVLTDIGTVGNVPAAAVINPATGYRVSAINAPLSPDDDPLSIWTLLPPKFPAEIPPSPAHPLAP